MSGDNIAHFDGFGVEHIPKEIKEFLSNKSIKAKIYRIQANDSIICEHFPSKYEKNGKIILKYFQ